MKCLSFVLYATLLHSVLGFLPAPVNVSVDSHNFHHILRWDPGPGTPPGTLYKIYNRVYGKTKMLNSTKTSLELLLDRDAKSVLTVEAYNNQIRSTKSHSVIFTPYADTKIGPAEFSLVGCGNCIQINISLPKPDQRSGVNDIQQFYDPQFIVLLRKEKEAVSQTQMVQTQKNFILKNLVAGEKYCVQVKTEIRTNKNTLDSAWKCTFTSIVEPRRDPSVLGAVAALLIVVVGVLIGSVFCLNYTGFLCKLQATLPRALLTALSRGYTLTPEKTIPDLISITSDMQQERAHNNPTSHPATSDSNSEEEEEEEKILYMDRNAELSSGESSFSSNNVSGSCKAATSGNSGNLTATSSAQVGEPAAEFEAGVVQGGLHQDDIKAEGATVSFIPEEDQTGVEGEQEEKEMNKKVEACDSSGNVNLFSVTIAALAVGEKEEDNTRHSLKPSDSGSDLQPTVSNLTLNNIDSQMTESDDQTTVALLHLNETGYEGRSAHTQEEEEEEEEFSEYMAHT